MNKILNYQIHSRKTRIVIYLMTFVFVSCVMGITNLNCVMAQSIDCDFDPEIEEFFHNIENPEPGIINSGGNCFALLVGIDDYNIPQILGGNLGKPECEIGILSQILIRQGYNVKSLKGVDVTRDNVLKWLECFKEKLNLTDRLLFYFAGHAKALSDLFSYMNRQTRAIYYKQVKQIISQKSVSSHDNLILMFRQSSSKVVSNVMSVDEIARLLSDSHANQKIMIIDACYSGQINKIFHLPLDVFSHRLLNDGFFALTSAKRPVEDGLTAPIFFKGLCGAADKTLAGNKDGFVSLYEATIYLDNELHRIKSNFKGEPYKSRYIFVGSGEVKMTRILKGN